MIYRLEELLTQYSEKNGLHNFEPVAVGKYGIRKRSEIYSKELAEDYSKNKVIMKDTLTIGLGTKQIDFGVLLEDVHYSVSPAYITFRINVEKIESKYLELYLKVFNEMLSDKYMIASARQGKKVDVKGLLKEEIFVPEKEQQLVIIKEIEEIYTLIKKDQDLKLNFEELIQSKFVQLFGNPMLNDKNWETKHFYEMGEFGRGVSKHRPRNAPELLGGEHPLIQTGDVANSDLYITKFEDTYSDLGLKQSKKWKKGTLCITIAANIAKTGILTFDACFPDSVVGFCPDPKITSPIFIHYWFTFLQEIIEMQAPLSAQKNINLQTLNNLDVMIPPIEIQEKFVEFIETIVEVKKLVDSRIKLYNELINKKMSDNFS